MKKGIKSYFVVPSVTINILAWYSLIFGGNITLSCEECKENDVDEYRLKPCMLLINAGCSLSVNY
jgi:hypothetical protein